MRLLIIENEEIVIDISIKIFHATKMEIQFSKNNIVSFKVTFIIIFTANIELVGVCFLSIEFYVLKEF